MDHIHIASDIIPIGEFKTHASKLIRQLGTTGRAMVITLNGRPGAVVISPEEFDRYREYRRFAEAVRAGSADADAGRLVDSSELDRTLDSEFGPAPVE